MPVAEACKTAWRLADLVPNAELGLWNMLSHVEMIVVMAVLPELTCLQRHVQQQQMTYTTVTNDRYLGCKVKGMQNAEQQRCGHIIMP